MAISFTTTAKAVIDAAVKLCVYAPAGYGKTCLNATLPTPILISIERGLLSLNKANIERLYGVNTPGISYDFPVIEITSFGDMDEAYKFVTQSEHARHFESIGLDSISDIAEVCLASAKKTNTDPRKAYGELAEKVSEMIRKFRDIPNKHVYFSAKQEKELDPGAGVMLYAPSMPGKELTKFLPHAFDELFNLGISARDPVNGSSYRFLRTRADQQFSAKDRSGCLAELEEPNLGKIIAKIRNKPTST